MDCQTLLSSHSQDILLKLDNDRKTSAKYCDITLVVDDHKYPAHKCVLGLLSPFYDKMFSIEMKEKHDNKAVIRGVRQEVFEAILDFIYTSKISLTMENVFEIMAAAHYMDLPYVKESCTEYLEDHVTPKNWSIIITCGKRYGYQELLEKVDNVLSAKFDAVMAAKNFVELEMEEIKHLLSLRNRNVKSETNVYEAVINWIKMDVLGREKYAEELLCLLKFSEMPLEFLTKVAAKEKLVENPYASLKALFRAIGNYKSPLPQQSAAIDQPSTSKQFVSPINGCVAVDSKTVWKMTTSGLEKTALKYNHAGGSAVKVDSEVLVISGCETKQIECYSVDDMKILSNESATTSSFRYAAAAIVIHNRIFVTGGLSSENSSECFTFLKQSYYYSEEITLQIKRHYDDFHINMKCNRQGHALALMCDAVYVFGGNVQSEQSALRFCVHNKKLTKLPPMNYLRSHSTAVVFDQEIYVIGGIYNRKSSSVVEKFNPLTDQWQIVSNLKVARNRPGVCVINNQIVVVGGGSGVIEVYDNKDAMKWKIVGECEELKEAFAIFSC